MRMRSFYFKYTYTNFLILILIFREPTYEYQWTISINLLKKPSILQACIIHTILKNLLAQIKVRRKISKLSFILCHGQKLPFTYKYEVVFF